MAMIFYYVSKFTHNDELLMIFYDCFRGDFKLAVGGVLGITG